MNFLVEFVLITIILIVIGIIVRFSIRSFYAEKRRHLAIMMRGTSGSVEPEFNEEITKDGSIVWKNVSKEKEQRNG